MFIVFISIVQGIIFLAHLVVYKTFVVSVAPSLAKGSALIWIRIFFLVMAIIFIAGSIFTYRRYSEAGKIFYRVAAVWLGTVFFLFLASVIIAIINLLFGLSPLVASFIFMLACLISVGSVLNSFCCER